MCPKTLFRLPPVTISLFTLFIISSEIYPENTLRNERPYKSLYGCQDSAGFHLRILRHPYTGKYYYLLESILQTDTNYKDKVSIGIVTSFMYKIYEVLVNKLKEKEHRRKVPERCEIVFDDFIKELNLFNGTEHSLSFFAKRLNLTPNYLSGRIKEYSGRTAMEWIEDSVILEAKTMLKHTDLSIQEIAYKLNFPTQTFFGKYFKRITGMSPKQYKNS